MASLQHVVPPVICAVFAQPHSQVQNMNSCVLTTGNQGNSGWDAYLSNRKARRISSTGGRGVKDMPMAGIVRAMVHMPRDLLEEVRHPMQVMFALSAMNSSG